MFIHHYGIVPALDGKKQTNGRTELVKCYARRRAIKILKRVYSKSSEIAHVLFRPVSNSASASRSLDVNEKYMAVASPVASKVK